MNKDLEKALKRIGKGIDSAPLHGTSTMGEQTTEDIKLILFECFSLDKTVERMGRRIAELEAKLKIQDDASDEYYCRACGGTNGHHEGCRGEVALLIRIAELEAIVDADKKSIGGLVEGYAEIKRERDKYRATARALFEALDRERDCIDLIDNGEHNCSRGPSCPIRKVINTARPVLFGEKKT